jgi:uncharacterized membrane protein YfcA
LSYLPKQSAAVTHIISVSLGVALLLTACAIIFRQKLQRYALAHADDSAHTQFQAPITVAVGALLGVLVTISSVGAGALGVAVLFFLYPKLPAMRIVGSDLAHAVPLTLVAGSATGGSAASTGRCSAACCSVRCPASGSAATLRPRVPERILRPILAGMLVLVGGKLIAQ